jgi:hypothetical protein
MITDFPRRSTSRTVFFEIAIVFLPIEAPTPHHPRHTFKQAACGIGVRPFRPQLLGDHELEKIHYPVGVTPLVVIPGHDLEEPLLSLEIVLKGGQ